MKFREISYVKMEEININQEIMDFIQFLVINNNAVKISRYTGNKRNKDYSMTDREMWKRSSRAKQII